MPQNKKTRARRDPLPKNFNTLEEFWNFWDTHSSADYEDLMDDVSVEIDISSSKVYYPVAKELIAHLRTHARKQGVSTETLINLWLRERVGQAAAPISRSRQRALKQAHGV